MLNLILIGDLILNAARGLLLPQKLLSSNPTVMPKLLLAKKQTAVKLLIAKKPTAIPKLLLAPNPTAPILLLPTLAAVDTSNEDCHRLIRRTGL